MPASPAASVVFVNKFDEVDFAWLNCTEKFWVVRPFETLSEIGTAIVVLCVVPPRAGITLNV